MNNELDAFAAEIEAGEVSQDIPEQLPKETKLEVEGVPPRPVVTDGIDEAPENIPLVITADAKVLYDIRKEANKRRKELEALIRNEQFDSKRKELLAELESVMHYENHIDYASRGLFNAQQLYGLFDKMAEWSNATRMDGKVSTCRITDVDIEGDESGYIDGEAAIKAMFGQSTGVGKPAEAPLVDSHIYIQVGNIEDAEVLRLVQYLSVLSDDLGFNTRGALYTASDVKIRGAITDFCLKHVTNSTLKETSYSELVKVFRESDTMALAACTLASIYADGYPFLYSCINDKDCTYNTFSNIKDGTMDNMPKLLHNRLTWYNHRRITPESWAFTNSAWASKTVEEVLEMQEKELKEIEIGPFNEKGDLIKMKIKAPLYIESREMNYNFLNDVVQSVEGVLRDTSNEASVAGARKRRAEFLTASINNLSLMKHEAWITEISTHTPKGVRRVKGANIKHALRTISGNDEIKANAERIIQQGKNLLFRSMTGVHNFKCPVCGELQNANVDSSIQQFTSIIPRNVVADFYYITALNHQD